jgi:hypothetical protein
LDIVFYFQNLFEMIQNILNEVKHHKVDFEKIKRDKEELEVKMGEEVGDEDLQRIGEFIGVIGSIP